MNTLQPHVSVPRCHMSLYERTYCNDRILGPIPRRKHQVTIDLSFGQPTKMPKLEAFDAICAEFSPPVNKKQDLDSVPLTQKCSKVSDDTAPTETKTWTTTPTETKTWTATLFADAAPMQ